MVLRIIRTAIPSYLSVLALPFCRRFHSPHHAVGSRTFLSDHWGGPWRL